MIKRPTVSVVTITYNQEKYIRQTLESFVAQQTDFKFEIVVADDHSTDKTADIVKEFAGKYPELFRPILRKKNIGAQKNSISALKAANGKYIALCEGDDYWTDPKKLQRQVDFLEKNPQFGLCFHPVRVFFENKEAADFIFPDTKEHGSVFTVKRLLKDNFIQTNSVMYRRQDYKDIKDDVMPLDWYLHLYHAQFGKIGFINKVMSAYRRHSGGMWWNSHQDMDEIWKKHSLSYIKLFAEFMRMYGSDPQYREIIYKSMFSIFNIAIDMDKKYKQELLKQAMSQFPGFSREFIVSQAEELKNAKEDAEKLKNESENLRQANQRLDQEKAGLQNRVGEMEWELKAIKNSRGYRLLEQIRKLVRLFYKVKRH